jgi:cell division protease FtsH
VRGFDEKRHNVCLGGNTVNSPTLWRPLPLCALKKNKNTNDLFSIDNKLNKLLNEIKELKKKKFNMLNNNRGLKLLNESEIEKIDLNMNNIHSNEINGFGEEEEDCNEDQDEEDEDEEDEEEEFAFLPSGIRVFFQNNRNAEKEETQKSENFEVIKGSKYNFTDIGGYETIKSELMQCADMLVNHKKYSKYNVRVPKGLILEGPPGNGKTLLAKCFAGQINVSFIPVSGAQFQEKFVGVGSSRVRELFSLAVENTPCIIFIDEIDAIGRKRSSSSGDSESGSERDSTLNELLVSLDGFKSTDGVFIMGATNRIDLLDSALTRPGRVDKSIYIGVPDKKTREAIIDIHIRGKPYGKSVCVEQLVEMTQGLSGAQIENLLNEAMLYAIRNGNTENEQTEKDETCKIEKTGLDFIFNRILVGSQSTENTYSDKLLYQIAIHEMGHAIVGLLCNDYNKLIKVSLNSWSPKTPGYTLFETDENDSLNNKKQLLSHLAVLLAGRIAEEEFFGEAITTGASKDLEDVKKIVYSMIIDYGMGVKLFYPTTSDKSKEVIDKEVIDLVDRAYSKAKLIITNTKTLIDECAKVLVTEQVLTEEFISKKIRNKYPHLLWNR